MQAQNPANQELLAQVQEFSKDQVVSYVKQAKAAQSDWAKLDLAVRQQALQRLHKIIYQNLEGLAELISQESGKPKFEAMSHDLLPALDLISYYNKKASKILKKRQICLGKWNFLGHRSSLIYTPYGVVGVIAPWNFPFSIPLGSIVPALLAGNAVVFKPSELASLVGKKIGELVYQAGVPENIFLVATGKGETGEALLSAGVDKIVFTGSVATGKKIMAACAQTLTPVSLELGGKDPMLVFDDADLDVASSAAVWGAFCNAGQVCASIERVYVQDSVAEKFTNLVVAKTKKLRLRSEFQSDFDIGAIVSAAQLQKIKVQVEEAKAQGAKILCGGNIIQTKGYFFAPTVITNLDHRFAIMKEETFGPVLPIMTFTNDEEAIRLANDSLYGLSAYVWTRDLRRGQLMAEKISAGTVNVNSSVFTHALPQVPWGGVKQSGMGRTHGEWGLLDLVQLKHVHVIRCPKKKNFFWWYPYTNDKVQMMRDLANALFGKGQKRVFSFFRFVKKSLKVKVD